MDFKKLFIGGLCASAVLAGCTKELSAPSVEGNQAVVSLGEGLTITGSKGSFGAETKAVYDNNLKPTWEESDMLGAAWYDAATKADAPNAKWVSQGNNYGTFMSNTWFKFDKWADKATGKANFKAEANLMAGAYVLYYPYEGWAQLQRGISVKVAPVQTMNITPGKEHEHLKDGMFFYTTYKATPGGTNLEEEFTMSPLTNVLRVRFRVDTDEILNLVKDLEIAQVVVEDKVGGILFENGTLNYSTKDIDYSEDLPEASYTPQGKTSQIILKVEGTADGYKIHEKDVATKEFFIAALPFGKELSDVEDLAFKIVTKDGKVYEGYPSETVMDEVLNAVAVEEGKAPQVNIKITKLADIKEIYTEQQFKDQWTEKNKVGKRGELNVKTDLDLQDFDLDPVVANITVNSGDNEVVVNNVNITTGALTVNNLTVNGDLSANGGLTVNGALTVEGDFEIKEDANITATTGTIAVTGKTYVIGKADAAALNIVKIGEIEVTTTGNFSVDGSKLEDGNGALGKVTNRGELTLTSVDLTGTLDNTGTVTIKQNVVVTSTGVINNEKTMTTAKATPLTNYGEINQNSATTTFFVNNESNVKKGKGTVNVNANITYYGANASEIKVAPGATLTLGSSTANGSYSGDGVINAEGTDNAKVTISTSSLQDFDGTIVANKYTDIKGTAANVFNNHVAFVVNKSTDAENLPDWYEAKVSTLRIKASDLMYAGGSGLAMNDKVLELYGGAKVTVSNPLTRNHNIYVHGNAEIVATVLLDFTGTSAAFAQVDSGAVLTISGSSVDAQGTVKVKTAGNVVCKPGVTDKLTRVLY